MKTTELTSTSIKAFNLALHEGKAVVRNQKRVQGLIGVRYSMIPELYHGLLANATFIGKREENKQIISSFQFNEDILDVSINEKAIHKAAIYKNLRIGQSYKIIKSFRNYILEQ